MPTSNVEGLLFSALFPSCHMAVMFKSVVWLMNLFDNKNECSVIFVGVSSITCMYSVVVFVIVILYQSDKLPEDVILPFLFKYFM